jgi:hypothetical protein
MTKKGDAFECEACGIEVVCSKDCKCSVCDVICCGVPMKVKVQKKAKAKK